MNKAFWLERWEKKEIGFHKTEVNPSLLLVKDHFNIQKKQTVFVPLCGKSVDMLWFVEQGLQVIGVELSPIGVEEFVKENKIK
jgi:thiopurine S-methyltransferase